MLPSVQDPDRFRNALAFMLIGAFVGVIPFLIFKTIPADNKETVVYVIGQLSGMATTALAFYFTNKVGADALDAKRAETTGKAFEAVTAAATAGTPTGSGAAASRAADEVADAAKDKADEIGDKAP